MCISSQINDIWRKKTCRLGMLAIFKRALDIALRNRKADFIKMDIEGAETNALVGAYQVVLRNKPTLAVSAYHQPGHLFQVPLLIKAMAPDYKLHLRHYREYAVSETVCCGISKKR